LKYKCAHVRSIHVSFGFDQQLAYFCAATAGSEMHCGEFTTTTTKSQEQFHQHNTTDSATNFKDECAPICRIRVTFGRKQQLARLCLTFASSFMQSGAIDAIK
jgi:hypothetical protein